MATLELRGRASDRQLGGDGGKAGCVIEIGEGDFHR